MTNPRNQAVRQIERLCALAKLIPLMIDEEHRRIARPGYPYADDQYNRVWSALCRAGYGVFEADELHDMAVEADPDWIVDERGMVTVIDERFGVVRGEAA